MEEMNQFELEYIYTWKCHRKPRYSYLKQTKMLFFFQKWKTRRQNKSCVGVCTCGSGEDVRRGCRSVNKCKYCVHLYVNGKVIPVETIPEMGENDGGGEFNYDVFDTL
jgi:hypothetical protein